MVVKGTLSILNLTIHPEIEASDLSDLLMVREPVSGPTGTVDADQVVCC